MRVVALTPRVALGQLLLATAASYFAWRLCTLAQFFWPFTLDDAYITLRYAKHVAQGHGPAWNVGGPPAEGYTTASWLAWLSLAEWVGPGLRIAKASGVAFAACAVLLSARIAAATASSAQTRALAAAVPLALGAAYWPLSLHAVSGMETTFSALVLTLFFWSTLRVQRAPTTWVLRHMALLALLSTLTRPEAAVACGATWLACVGRLPRPIRPALVRQTLLWAVAPGALYFAARWAYFGLPLPLSFYVKTTGQPVLAGWPDVVEFFGNFGAAPWWLALAALGFSTAKELLPALCGALALLLFFLFPAHIMAFEGRYLLPLLPLLGAASGAGLSVLLGFVPLGPRSRAATAAAFVAMLALFQLPRDYDARAATWLAYGHGLQRAHVALASDMLDSPLPQPSIALLDVGAIGYHADWPTIDTFGLNDPHVALTYRRDVEYVLKQAPTFLVLVSSTPDRFTTLFDWEEPLYRGALREGYRFACDYKFDGEYYLHVLTHPRVSLAHARLCRGCDRRQHGSQ